MFKEEFVDLVSLANGNAQIFYSDANNSDKPNPYYIGFGNPDADLLILGKEKGFEKDNSEQLRYESINNPSEWHYNIKNSTSPHRTRFNKDSEYYLNAYFPYEGRMKSGHTWTKYNNLVEEIFGKNDPENNSFLKYSFISEINPEPSKESKIRIFNNEDRIKLLSHKYFKTFKITILACGNYLSRNVIEEIFEVKYCEDLSMSRQKLVIFKNESRLLVNTRQLSMDIPNGYIQRIAEQVRIFG